MKDYEKTKAQLVHEITDLRMRFATLEITARECMQLETEIQDAREYAENIVETVREPLVVLNSELKILTANHSFYQTFKVTPAETIGNFIYDVGNRQWDIPKLRVLVEEILPLATVFGAALAFLVVYAVATEHAQVADFDRDHAIAAATVSASTCGRGDSTSGALLFVFRLQLRNCFELLMKLLFKISPPLHDAVIPQA